MLIKRGLDARHFCSKSLCTDRPVMTTALHVDQQFALLFQTSYLKVESYTIRVCKFNLFTVLNFSSNSSPSGFSPSVKLRVKISRKLDWIYVNAAELAFANYSTSATFPFLRLNKGLTKGKRPVFLSFLFFVILLGLLNKPSPPPQQFHELTSYSCTWNPYLLGATTSVMTSTEMHPEAPLQPLQGKLNRRQFQPKKKKRCRKSPWKCPELCNPFSRSKAMRDTVPAMHERLSKESLPACTKSLSKTKMSRSNAGSRQIFANSRCTLTC